MNEKGITLIALIITIIILVILAAVSIRSITNMKIVDYAINGATNYAREGKVENSVLDDATSLLDKVVENITSDATGKASDTSGDDDIITVPGGYSHVSDEPTY